MSLENRTRSVHGRLTETAKMAQAPLGFGALLERRTSWPRPSHNIIAFMPSVPSERFALHLDTSALQQMRICDDSAVLVRSDNRKDADA
ncbi:hypothetical protein HC749_13965 [Arthrobacter sp. S13_S34]|nr:hypothetical protein [Arthrobacter sp. S13_S34]